MKTCALTLLHFLSPSPPFSPLADELSIEELNAGKGAVRLTKAEAAKEKLRKYYAKVDLVKRQTKAACSIATIDANRQNLAFFSKEACASINGVFLGNGECRSEEGFNWSWRCRRMSAAEKRALARKIAMKAPVVKFLHPCSVGKTDKTRAGLRFYSRLDCKVVGGRWKRNGTCRRKGRDFSWACRDRSVDTLVREPLRRAVGRVVCCGDV
jgi:hypothetical protein